MRKLMLLAAMLAIVLVAAAPAIAQVGQGFGQGDVESGDVEPTVEISNEGDNSNLCPTVLQNANSGNVLNAQGVVQYASTADDIEFGGSSIVMGAETAGECVQSVEQAAAASG